MKKNITAVAKLGPSPWPEDPEIDGATIQSALRKTASSESGRGIKLISRQGTRDHFDSWKDFSARALEAAARWKQLGLQREDRVLISLPTSWEFLEAWMGALFLGGIPAATAPILPGKELDAGQADRLVRMSDSIGASWILVSPRLREKLVEAEKFPCPDRLITSEGFSRVEAASGLLDEDSCARPGDLAFLQFTSGSTTLPKAVMISHQAAMVNIHGINAGLAGAGRAWATEEKDTVVSWLPLHHDMGLVGCFLFALVHDLNFKLMSPTTFLAKPELWLQEIDGNSVLSPAPNFGYQYCVDRLDDYDFSTLDLSRFKALTGSEMIQRGTGEAFSRLTAPAGFSPENFISCYGMAETALAITFDRKHSGLRTCRPPFYSGQLEFAEVTCVGVPVPEMEVEVCPPDGSPLSENQVGEIRVRGSSLFSGYFKAGDSGHSKRSEDDWFYTGDIGFVFHNELYICGRTKELIIIRGENVMPHDLEGLADESREKRGVERSGAFSITRRESAGEEVVLVMEVSPSERNSLAGLESRVKSRLGRARAIVLADCVFVRRGRIPKTTSGKIKRGTLKDLYLQQKLERLTPPSPSMTLK